MIVPPGDLVWTSKNEWGIPELLLSQQALTPELPFNRWGTNARKHRVSGTYHFYTDDYRFEGVWQHPEKVVNSGVSTVVEPNFSTNDQMPRAVVLGLVYRKRWLARYWQENGIKVLVDLALDPAHRDLTLLGVPRGWKSYATYTNTINHKIEWIFHDYQQACKHAGTDEITFVVYGGEKSFINVCREHGWLWFPAHQQQYHRNVSGESKIAKERKQLEERING